MSGRGVVPILVSGRQGGCALPGKLGTGALSRGEDKELLPDGIATWLPFFFAGSVFFLFICGHSRWSVFRA